ncbi:MAG: hypothetical protein ACKO9H_19615, partial [Planctomycetota bacterium]
ERMMKKSPADRIPSCEKLLQAIEICRESLVPAVTSANEQYLPSASARQATRPVAARQTPPSAQAKQVSTPAATATTPARHPLKPPSPPIPPSPPPVPAATVRPATTPKSAAAAPAAQSGATDRPKPVAPATPRPVSEKQASPPGPTTAPPAGPGIVIDTHQVAPKKSVGEVGDLLVQAPTRPRKRGKTNSLPANLIVAAIVLICFLVLVGMVIILARVFGS